MKVVIAVLALAIYCQAQEFQRASHECQIKQTRANVLGMVRAGEGNLNLECVDRSGVLSERHYSIEARPDVKRWPPEWAAPSARNFYYMLASDSGPKPLKTPPSACEPGQERFGPVPGPNTCGALFPWPDGRRR
jgi:hypothetical protein